MNAGALTAFNELSTILGVSGTLLWVILAAVVLWTVILKGFALWYAARNYQRTWFVVLLIVNTFGLLELVYLIWFRADKDENATPSLFNTPEGPVSSSA